MAVQSMVQKCLHFIAYAEPRLTIHQLRQAVSTPDNIGAYLDDDNTISEREISGRCSSLIRKSEDGQYFEFAHFSVQEFLENKAVLIGSYSQPSLQHYFIERRMGNKLLTMQCLRFLQLSNFDQRPSSVQEAKEMFEVNEKSFPFYFEATIRWPEFTKHHLEDADGDGAELLTLMTSLFHPQKTSQFTVWAMRLAYAYLKDALYHDGLAHTESPFSEAWGLVSDDKLRPLHIAAALSIPDICSHLLKDDTAPQPDSTIFTPFDLAIMTLKGL